MAPVKKKGGRKKITNANKTRRGDAAFEAAQIRRRQPGLREGGVVGGQGGVVGDYQVPSAAPDPMDKRVDFLSRTAGNKRAPKKKKKVGKK